jgi:chromosome segregation ATPase
VSSTASGLARADAFPYIIKEVDRPPAVRGISVASGLNIDPSGMMLAPLLWAPPLADRGGHSEAVQMRSSSMQQPYTPSQELETKPHNLPSAMSLAERLDPAIGEATSVMGAVVTELMRRSLRGGVMRIGDELNGFVSEQVDQVIADRTPVLEELASTVADKTARLAATEVATEEVHALEERTTESNRQLSAEIEATRQAAEQSTAEAARDLSARIALAEQQAQVKTLETAQELTSKIQETEKRVVNKAETQLQETEKRVVDKAEAQLNEHARSLTDHIEATGKHTLQAAEAKVATEAQGLVRKIEEAEQRVQTTVRAEFSGQVQELMQRARERSDRLKSRFSELETALAGADKKHDALRSQLAELLRANELLTARVTELEKPRGLRALFAWLFGRRKKASAPAAVEEAT